MVKLKNRNWWWIRICHHQLQLVNRVHLEHLNHQLQQQQVILLYQQQILNGIKLLNYNYLMDERFRIYFFEENKKNFEFDISLDYY